MVWDGECEFCRLCADRFKSAGADTVEFIPFQDLHSKYPKAPQLDYKKSVVFFSKNSEAGRRVFDPKLSQDWIHGTLSGLCKSRGLRGKIKNFEFGV